VNAAKRLRIVAIDGPAGAGKSTVARALANMLNVPYLDTGAMYRGVAYAALQQSIDTNDAPAIGDLSRRVVFEITETTLHVNGVDATAAIRGDEVTAAVSAVAANPIVREDLRTRQRQWVNERGGGVVEGRDIGTVVFPDATLKVYLTASPRIRAERRVAQSGGGDVNAIAAAIAERDYQDSTRADSPLREASDSVTVDTSDRGIDDVVQQLLALVDGIK